jgi:phosphoribosyl-AMP cyclohydrolase
MEKETTLDLMLEFDKLVPVVTQDIRTKDVLLLAYTNRKAFEETLRSGYATYWSRSMGKLWKKGETSGDLLRVVEMRINCEQNSLLYLAEMMGTGACHAKDSDGKAYPTCYYRRIEGDKLELVI